MNYKTRNNEMHSYFTNSFFIKSIYNPVINNKVRYFDITNAKSNPTVFWQEKIWGNFLVEINDQSIMLDNAEFIMTLQAIKTNDFDGVEIRNEVNLARCIAGSKEIPKNIRDEYFSNVPHTDIRCKLEIKEYYKILKNNKLIHYIDGQTYFEIYNLKDNYDKSMGLDILYTPQFYDKIEHYDENSLEYEEIASIFNKNTKNK